MNDNFDPRVNPGYPVPPSEPDQVAAELADIAIDMLLEELRVQCTVLHFAVGSLDATNDAYVVESIAKALQEALVINARITKVLSREVKT